MKRILFAVLAACLLVGQASAEMYTLDTGTAQQFTEFTVSDGSGELKKVTTSLTEYGRPSMLGEVGYAGWMYPDTDKSAIMRIGPGSNLEYSQSYEGFRAFLANDNDDTWSVRLFVAPSEDNTLFTEWVQLAPGTSSWLTLNESFSFTDVANFGFEISSDEFDAFHISAVVPAPVAVLLGLLGLGTAGLKLRKYV